MSAEHPCAKCGAVLTANAPKGLCPRCLMGAALVGADSVDGAATLSTQPFADDNPGACIDRYKILQRIGEGGCGVVYMAEQTDPVRRRVALKVIKLGMDTKQVIARFEAERQALALMDHPNIAKVLDAGATTTGRPYFVMELVKGIRITQYCDRNHLGTPERLALFTQVCQAIQHAHQKGIIHRDIKPSNILVTLHDGVPVPKVIDFGIAKATEQPLTEKTVFTALGQFLGTPAYMSPEQAELSGLDIDTRSDIYGLGVLLYELLTGTTPFDANDLLHAGFDEMRRRIREDEPMRPSTRLNTMADADLTTIAQQRHSEPARLTRFIRGDLDWIVMKCLEKDRTRRYETANGLAMDIRRHLENEPVVACPPSSLYRLQKLVRRNKLAVSAVSAVATALLVGLGLSTWLWLAERKAHHLAVLAELKSLAKEKEASESEAEMRRMLEFLTGTVFSRTVAPTEYHAPTVGSTNEIEHLVPPGDPRLNGETYANWAAAWWKWGLEMLKTNAAGAIHPFYDSPRFDVTVSQTGEVWFLGAPFLTPPSTATRRSCVIPPGKSLFIQLIGAESSSLEPRPFLGATAEDQAAIAQYWADHIAEVHCEIDGIPVSNLSRFRVQSPQVSFTAPTPWIMGEVGGEGTSSGDGYFVFLSPLAPGQHTIRYGGTVRFTKPQDPFDKSYEIDMTYDVTVAAVPPQNRSDPNDLNLRLP